MYTGCFPVQFNMDSVVKIHFKHAIDFENDNISAKKIRMISGIDTGFACRSALLFSSRCTEYRDSLSGTDKEIVMFD